ncbi:hypothetical protein EI94DRAFT_1724630 [Lactarius quietus]|nr:hypothetical protein EI94DRAFT_1724630 [Lactarius quietus]
MHTGGIASLSANLSALCVCMSCAKPAPYYVASVGSWDGSRLETAHWYPHYRRSHKPASKSEITPIQTIAVLRHNESTTVSEILPVHELSSADRASFDHMCQLGRARVCGTAKPESWTLSHAVFQEAHHHFQARGRNHRPKTKAKIAAAAVDNGR